MIDIQITTTIQISEQRVLDILTTAREGGIDYWADTRHTKRNEQHDVISFECVDNEDDAAEWVEVNSDTIVKGITLLLNGNKEHHTSLRCELLKGEDGDYDAGGADVIVQYGLFGELVFS